MTNPGRPRIGSIGWIDLTVDDAEWVRDLGEVIAGPRGMDADRYCVIRDPAGAVAALYQRG